MAEYFVSEQLQAVAAARGESAAKARAKLLSVAKGLRLATACSGTDSPVVPETRKFVGFERISTSV